MSIPPIHSIVVGDVGSGKTAVAQTVALAFIVGRYPNSRTTIAMIAPTTILATQHYYSFARYIEALSTTSIEAVGQIDLVLVTNDQKRINGEIMTKKNWDQWLKNQTKDNSTIWIGTHAIWNIKDLKPDLVLVDEQHRFGVGQRSAFQTDTHSPHFISFSATPIPRTLARTVYRDLDMQIVSPLAKKAPIKTRTVPIQQLELVKQAIITHLSASIPGKVYVIVPAVEKSEEEGDNTEEQWTVSKAKQWAESFLPGSHIIATSGQDKQKTQALQQFKTNAEISVCIATTVVEVGVDVGEATLIVIFQAERFGLATLHQLRGRVGRNQREDNECILVSTYPTKRLSTIVNSQDGFVIAEHDLQERGAGSLEGTAQSGEDRVLEHLFTLPPEEYESISNAVDAIDWLDQEYKRLLSYTKQASEKSWKE